MNVPVKVRELTSGGSDAPGKYEQGGVRTGSCIAPWRVPLPTFILTSQEASVPHDTYPFDLRHSRHHRGAFR